RTEPDNLSKTRLDEGKLIVLHPMPGLRISNNWQKYCFELSGLTLISLQRQRFVFLVGKSTSD
nr:hypothetical protein [Desulfobacteraceae bacterium]